MGFRLGWFRSKLKGCYGPMRVDVFRYWRAKGLELTWVWWVLFGLGIGVVLNWARG